MTTTPPPSDPHQPDDGALPSFPTGDPGAPTPQQPGAAVTQPSTIAGAVKLMWAGGVVSVLSLIVSLATLGSQKDQIADQLRETDPNVSQTTIDTAFAVGVAFGVVLGAVGAGLWFWMAWKNGQGRSWARIVATALGGLNIVSTLIGFAVGNQQGLVTLLTAVNLVIAVVALFLLWRKESSAYFAAVTQSRMLR